MSVVVDTHVHIWEISEKYPVGPTAPQWTSTPDEPATAEQLIEDMDENGVDWTVIVQTSWSTWDNGYMADSAAKYPDRLIGHGMLDPQDEAGNAEAARYWMEDRGLVGFRFHPMYYKDEKVLTTEGNRAMWEVLADHEAVIQFHTSVPFADQIDEIAQRHPRMKLLIDHMGYPTAVGDSSTWQPILDLAQRPNVHVKISDVKGASEEDFPFRDRHVYVKALVDTFGADRCLWGTGYPAHHRVKHGWLSLADELRLVREGFDFLGDAQRDRILGGTAAEVWGLAS
ncbi:MAG: amidohydrolase family protein [Candidatus Latescibacterota bacterium]|nr:amidohydrolase family protein [Candidatus Latescibacterota bacterium]